MNYLGVFPFFSFRLIETCETRVIREGNVTWEVGRGIERVSGSRDSPLRAICFVRCFTCP